jgi:hypothetical protein
LVTNTRVPARLAAPPTGSLLTSSVSSTVLVALPYCYRCWRRTVDCRSV